MDGLLVRGSGRRGVIPRQYEASYFIIHMAFTIFKAGGMLISVLIGSNKKCVCQSGPFIDTAL